MIEPGMLYLVDVGQIVGPVAAVDARDAFAYAGLDVIEEDNFGRRRLRAHAVSDHARVYQIDAEGKVMAVYEMSCPVCGSPNHIHCSKGCKSCDDPNNPHPVFAETHCPVCKKCFCLRCMSQHVCGGNFWGRNA